MMADGSSLTRCQVRGWPRAVGRAGSDMFHSWTLPAVPVDPPPSLSDLAKLTGPAPLLPGIDLRHLVLPVLPVLHRELPGHDPPAVRSQRRLPRQPLGRHRLEEPEHLGRLGMELQPVPRPHRVRRLGRLARTSTSPSTSTPRSPTTTRSTPRPRTSQATPLSDNGTQAVWDWGNVAQAESYFDTADPTQNAVGETWLDWCCDASEVSTPGVTPDAWINYLTAQQMVNQGERGFDLSRIGASLRELAGRLVPLRPLGRPPQRDRVHRRHPGHLEHPRLPGAAQPGRGQHRRALRQRRHRQLPRQLHRQRQRPGRSLPALAATRHVPADHARALELPARTRACRGSTTPPPRPSATSSCSCARNSSPTSTRSPTRPTAPASR